MLAERDVAAVGPGRLSWGAIFGGTFAAMGVWVLLALFGLAVGLSSVSPQEPNLRGVGVWLGVWTLLIPIIAMFVGGALAARSSTTMRKSTGALHGVVVWALATIAGTLLTVMLVSSVVRGTVSTTGQVLSAAGGAVAGVAKGAAGAGGNAAQAISGFLNIDRTELVNAANQELAQRGLPPLRPEQLQAAVRDAAQTGLRQGRMDREILTDALVRNTKLERGDVQGLAGRLEQQWNETSGAITQQAQQVGSAVQSAALKGVDAIGKSLWVVFGSTLLGLIAAVAGGIVMAGRTPEVRVAEQVVPTGPRFEPTPVGT